MEKVPGHGLGTATSPAGRRARRLNIPGPIPVPIPVPIPGLVPCPFPICKSIIGRLSNRECELYGVWRSFPMLKVDPWLILLEGYEGFRGFEADRLRDRILFTRRTWRGRDWDFIFTKNFVRPRSGFYLHKEFRATGVRFYLHKFLMGPQPPVLIRIY